MSLAQLCIRTQNSHTYIKQTFVCVKLPKLIHRWYIKRLQRHNDVARPNSVMEGSIFSSYFETEGKLGSFQAATTPSLSEAIS